MPYFETGAIMLIKSNLKIFNKKKSKKSSSANKVKSFDISVRLTKVLTSFDCIIKSRHRPAFDDYYSVHSDCILYLDLRFWSNTYDMKDQII